MVSVIMPAYNTEKYIAQSIQSVQKQSCTDWELIIVNDGSTDGTGVAAQRFAAADDHIRFIDSTNQGVSAARNQGLQMARGEYIAFLDSDDLWEPDFLAKMLKKSEEVQGDFFYAGTDMFLPDGRIETTSTPYIEGKLDAFITPWHEFRVPFHISGIFLRRHLLDTYRIGFAAGFAISEDIGFYMEILCVADAHCVPEVLTHYRKRASSASTRAWSPERWESAVLIHAVVEPYVHKYYPEAMPRFAAMRNYRTYRFVWGTIKAGYIKAGMAYVRQWETYLRQFVQGPGKFNDRLKCWLLLRQQSWILDVLRKL